MLCYWNDLNPPTFNKWKSVDGVNVGFCLPETISSGGFAVILSPLWKHLFLFLKSRISSLSNKNSDINVFSSIWFLAITIQARWCECNVYLSGIYNRCYDWLKATHNSDCDCVCIWILCTRLLLSHQLKCPSVICLPLWMSAAVWSVWHL